MAKHVDAGPSAASAWIKCPARVTQCRGLERKSSSYARDGSAKHYVGELLFAGKAIPASVAIDGEEIPVTEEIIEAAKFYYRVGDAIRANSTWFKVEERVSLAHLFAPEEIPEPCEGTADILAYDSESDTATVADAKFGTITVDPNSPQLKLYMLGALERFGSNPPKRVRLIIIQPNGMGSPVRVHEMGLYELTKWFTEFVAPALDRIAKDDKTEVAGDHCRWCPRAGVCGALHQTAIESAKMTFADTKPPVVADLSSDDLGSILDKAELIDAFVKAVRAEVSARIDRGGEVLGWRLAPKRAMRKWQRLTELQEYLADEFSNLSTDELYSAPEFKSPAQIEKVFKKNGIDFSQLDSFISRESSGTTLVREADDRPRVLSGPAAAFSALSIDVD